MALTKKLLSAFITLALAMGLLGVLYSVADQLKTPSPAYAEDLASSTSAEQASGSLEDLIEFIYVDSTNLGQGDTQLIAVGLADESAQLEDMVLSYTDRDGVVHALSAMSLVGNAAAFEMTADEHAPLGLYKLTQISFQAQGQTQVIDLSNEQASQYGFNIVGEEALELLSAEDSTSVADDPGDVCAYTIDDQGSLVAQDSLDEAIDSADAGGVMPLSVEPLAGGLTIALDPGHGLDPNTGSWDPGASANGVVEADCNWAIACACQDELKQYGGANVIMVPRFRSLNDRVDWAVSNGANVYVSLHINSATPAAQGFEIYVPNESSFNYSTHAEGYALGQKIQTQLRNLGLYDRGIKYRDSADYRYNDGHFQDYYTAIERSRGHGIPGLIVEHAFVTNENDANFLRNPDNLRRLGVADAQAIAEHYQLNRGPLILPEITKTQTVADGLYRIGMRSDLTKVLDVEGASTAEHANVLVWNDGLQDNQLFKVSYLGDGSYSIINKNSNKALTAAGDGLGANLEQASYTGAPNQRWHIVDLGEGLYAIVNAGSNLFVNVTENNTNPGANVLLWDNNGHNEEFFYFEHVADVPKTRTVPDGSYRIAMSSDQNSVLDVANASHADGANVIVWPDGNQANQTFNFHYLGDGSYSIINMNSGKALAVVRGGLDLGSNVEQQGYDGSLNQRWYLVSAGGDRYNLVSAFNGLYLNITGNNTAPGTNALVWEHNNHPEEQFYLKGVPKERTVDDGVYRLAMKSNPTMVLDVDNASLDDGANVLLWHDEQKANQLFKVSYLGDGSYSIINENSGKAISVPEAGYYNGANVEQQSYTGAANQRWFILKDDGGCHQVVNAQTGLLLNVAANDTTPGTNILSWENNGGYEEFFHFVPQGSWLGGQTVKNGTYRIAMGSDQNAVLDVANASRDDGANVLIWPDGQQPNQLFRFTYLGDGSYSIVNYNSGKALSAASGTVGANVEQRAYTGDPTQRWYVTDLGNDRYAFVSLANGLMLNVVENRNTPGTNVLVWFDNDSPEECFALKRYATPIMGEPQTTVAQMVSCYQNSGYAYPSEVYAEYGAPTIQDYCQALFDEAKAEGVRPEALFCQAMKETRWLQFGGQVKAEQCNFGGLGATNNGAAGASFSSVSEGLRAQVQHLKAYASTAPLVKPCVDPRFDLVSRGIAPYLEDLDGRWAVPGDGYGEDISFMIASLLRY